MNLKFSKRFHIPLLVACGREFYPWQLGESLRAALAEFKLVTFYHKQLRTVSFSPERWDMIRREFEGVWKKHYLPARPLGKGALILDAGAGEGETILFFASHGFYNFRAIEPDPKAYERMISNSLGLRVTGYNRLFRLEDVFGVDFAKVDIEGGERELLQLTGLPCEIVVEIHGANLLEEFKDKFRNQVQVEWSAQLTTYPYPLYVVRLLPNDSAVH